MAIENNNSDAERKMKMEFDEYVAVYRKSRVEIDRKLSDEITYLNNLSKEISDKNISEKISSQQNEIKSMRQWTSRFMDQLESTSLWGQKANSLAQPSLMSEQDNQRLLEKIYMWGFEKTAFVETMEFNN